MTYAVANGDPVRFNPYPGGVQANNQFPFMKSSKEKDVARVQAALTALPSIKDMKKCKNAKELQTQLDASDPLAFPLLKWIFTSCQAMLQYLPADKVSCRRQLLKDSL
jgi:hypothetical protein